MIRPSHNSMSQFHLLKCGGVGISKHETAVLGIACEIDGGGKEGFPATVISMNDMYEREIAETFLETLLNLKTVIYKLYSGLDSGIW